MKRNIVPKITLVGAGPGDPELITIKGYKALSSADVILYDALVNENLLRDFQHKQLIFVGKRKGITPLPQKEINQLMVKKAIEHGHVVRLKGGDPFVFGRGYEEIQYAAAFSIPVEVVPGISSAIAGPTFGGIPVTHRGYSTSFTVITATCSDGIPNQNLKKLPSTEGTIVILMGLSCLEKISEIYKSADKQNQPFAVVSNASLPNQKTVVGTANTIVKRVQDAHMKAPAIIVIGEVVKLINSVILEEKSFVLN